MSRVEPEDEWGGFQPGDRIVYVGPSDDVLKHGDQGLVVDVSKFAEVLVVGLDETGACDMCGPTYIRHVDDQSSTP